MTRNCIFFVRTIVDGDGYTTLGFVTNHRQTDLDILGCTKMFG